MQVAARDPKSPLLLVGDPQPATEPSRRESPAQHLSQGQREPPGARASRYRAAPAPRKHGEGCRCLASNHPRRSAPHPTGGAGAPARVPRARVRRRIEPRRWRARSASGRARRGTPPPPGRACPPDGRTGRPCPRAPPICRAKRAGRDRGRRSAARAPGRRAGGWPRRSASATCSKAASRILSCTKE